MHRRKYEASGPPEHPSYLMERRFEVCHVQEREVGDCHVEGLRVLETRPPLIVHDRVPSTVGERDSLPLPTRTRIAKNASRVRRKIKAARSFVRAWGIRELLSFFPSLR